MSYYMKSHSIDEMIAYVCKNDFKYFLKKPYVIGVGLGYKRKNNFYTCEKCIQVFVVRKPPKSQISAYDMIPSTYKGIKTDVIETGMFAPSSLRNRKRPVPGGYSIAPYNIIGECTAGCLVTNGPVNFVLSVSHVLSRENQFHIGHNIIQPPYIYGGRAPEDLIARLHKYIPIRFTEGEFEPINLVDAGIGVLTNPVIIKPEIDFIGKVTTVKSPKLNGVVKKVGCATELTEGRITSVNATIDMGFDDTRALFQEMIITTKMSEKGDSGALLVNNNNCGVGIICGSSDNESLSCRLDSALAALDVKLVQ